MAAIQIPEGKELWKSLRALVWTLIIALGAMVVLAREWVASLPVIGGFVMITLFIAICVALYPFVRKRWP